MIRGINKMDMFLDKYDKVRFLETLTRMKEEGEYTLYGYCLMDNHVHLLIKEDRDTISRTMKRINVSYSQYFNQKYERIGPLFQDRFRSENIETEGYILSCIRYIHNNPVKAGIVRDPKNYIWSSYSIYMGRHNDEVDLVDTSFILNLLSHNESTAIERFIKYSNEDSKDIFIDYEENMDKKEIGENHNITEILNKYDMNINDFRNCRDKNKRNAIINEIKENSKLSLRQIARITGISKDIIYRC